MNQMLDTGTAKLINWALKGKEPGPKMEEGIGWLNGWNSAFNCYNCISIGNAPVRKRKLEGDMTFLRRFTASGHILSLHILKLDNGEKSMHQINCETFWAAGNFKQLAEGAFWTFNEDFRANLLISMHHLVKNQIESCIKILSDSPKPYNERENEDPYFTFARVKKLHLFRQEKKKFGEVSKDDKYNRIKVLEGLNEYLSILELREIELKSETDQSKEFSAKFTSLEWSKMFEDALLMLLHPIQKTPLLRTLNDLKEKHRRETPEKQFEKPDYTDWQFLYLIHKFHQLGAFNADYNSVARLFYKKIGFAFPKNTISGLERDIANEWKLQYSPKRNLMEDIDGFVESVIC